MSKTQQSSQDDSTETIDYFDKLCNEHNTVTITHSDTDGIHVETDSFSGTHRVWYSKYNGPRLHTKGLYDCPDGAQIECKVPWFDAIEAEFQKEYGGSKNGEETRQ